MDPSDYDKGDLGNRHSGGHGPTHANGGLLPGGDGWLRSFLENSSEVVKIVDPDGTLRYASPAFEWILGYDPAEAAGRMNVLDHVHPDDLPRVLAETQKALAEGKATSNRAEYRFRHEDGSWRWIESVGTYLLDDPAVGGVVVTVRDITWRKEAEEALRQSEAELFSVLESITDAFFTLDHEMRFAYVNPRAEVLMNRKREDLVGEKLWEDPTFYPEYRRAVAEGKTVEFEGYYPPLKRWYGVRAYPSQFGLSVYFQDVTERKEAEERYRTLVEKVPPIIYIQTPREGETAAYDTTYMSPRVEEVLGYPPQRFTEDPGFWDRLIHPEDLGAVREEDERTDETGEPFSMEYRLIDKDGRTVWIRDEATLVRDEEGKPLYWLGVQTDVTAHRLTEARLREAEASYRSLVERVPVAIYRQEIDHDGAVSYISPQIEAITGYAPEEYADPTFWIRTMHPEDRKRVLAEDERTDRTGEPFRVEFRKVARDGRIIWLRDEAVLVRDPSGEPLYWQGVVSDITERKDAERTLRESELRFRSSFDDAAIGMALVGLDGQFLRVNRSLCEILGYPRGELLEKSFQDVTHPADLHKDLEHLRRLVAGEVRTYQMEKRYLHRKGHVVWALLSVSLVHDEGGGPLYFVSQVQDIGERKRMEGQLQRQALHDDLTGLPNRKLLMDRLRQALERTRRRRGREVAVLFMDLDGFKVVNDSLGHEAGDLLLTVVAQRLRRCLRPEDTLARFGGDEFVVLIGDVNDPAEAVRVAERITGELRRPFVLDGKGLFASASIGIALGDARTKTPEDLLRNADTAMYRAKEEGGGYSVFDPAMHGRAVDRLELENDLRRAIERDEFVVHYQPIVRLDDRRIFAMEALVRWEHPERGLLNPDEFVPVAEQSGLVVPMGEQVLWEACRRARAWQDEHPQARPPVISVNLSARQLGRHDLAKVVKETLNETGLEARCLSLDVTETVYVRALEDNTAALSRLRAMGVGISIDDFGTGYSSLAYLKRLPADALKIDRSFVRGLGEDVEDTAIVRTIIELAHTMGMEVVAEGVESEGQAALLAEMGCDFAQGYLFSRPLPPQEVPGLLAG